MNMLNTAVGMFGPFHSIQTLDDRLRCDGVDYQFSVIGTYTVDQGLGDRPEPQPEVPESVPMLNARIAMLRAGWLVPWEALLAAMEGQEGEEARIKWASALTVRRDDPLVAIGIAALGKTEEEAGALFISAAALNL